MHFSIPKGDKKYSFAEYMAIEETSIEKNDFYYGELFSMADGTKNHNNIILNVGIFIKENK